MRPLQMVRYRKPAKMPSTRSGANSLDSSATSDPTPRVQGAVILRIFIRIPLLSCPEGTPGLLRIGFMGRRNEFFHEGVTARSEMRVAAFDLGFEILFRNVGDARGLLGLMRRQSQLC